jgi:DNA-binding HxlR family transcriptional regulator
MAAPLWPADDPIVRALDVLRSRSGFVVMREAYYGTRRFDDLAQRTGMSPSSLATRLRALVADGLLRRAAYHDPGARKRDEYVLTDKGVALLPVLVALHRWGSEHLTPSHPGVELVHSRCGTPVRAEVRCGHGHEVRLAELRAVGDEEAR